MEKNNIKIAGSGFINGGSYGKIKIMGSASSTGDVCGEHVVINGDASFNGNLDFNYFKVNGDARIDGHLKASEVKLNGDLTISGSCEIDKLVVNGDFKIDGAIKCNNVTIRGDLKGKDSVYANELNIYGRLKIDKNVEGENIKIHGDIKCDGLLTGEKIVIYPSGRSTCKEIGATNLDVLKYKSIGIWPFRISFGNRGTLKCDLIEGDNISLEKTTAKTIRGKNVSLLSKCEVGNIEYSDTVEISTDSTVKSSTKVI